MPQSDFSKPGVAGNPAFPEFVVDRLACGESRLKVYREYRGISDVELGKMSGIQLVRIWDIENGHAVGSDDVLKRLAEALDVDARLLVPSAA